MAAALAGAVMRIADELDQGFATMGELA